MTRFVFITGGVVSSLGKGIASAALGALLQARGYQVRLRKLDPYLNVDPGTMSPYQHGEVFVTDMSMVSPIRAEMLPEVPWLMPSSFIRRASATMAWRRAVSSVISAPWPMR